MFILLFNVVNHVEQSVPADATQSLLVRVGRPPNEDGFAHDVVLWHKSPVAAVCRIVTVVAHHPIVIHFEGVALGQSSIDVYLVILNLQFVIR